MPTLIFLSLALSLAAPEPAPVGMVLELKGDVKLKRANGVLEHPEQGRQLYPKDSLTTGDDGRLTVVFYHLGVKERIPPKSAVSITTNGCEPESRIERQRLGAPRLDKNAPAPAGGRAAGVLLTFGDAGLRRLVMVASANMSADELRSLTDVLEGAGREPRDRVVLGVAYFLRGRLANSASDHRAAMVAYREAEALFDSGQAFESQAIALVELGTTFLERGRYSIAAAQTSPITTYNPRDVPNPGLNSDTKEALNYYRKALDLQQQVLGEAHREVVASWWRIGNVYYEHRYYDDSLKCFEKCLALADKELAKDDPMRSDILYNLGHSLLAKGNPSRALQCYQESLKIAEKAYGKDGPIVASRLRVLSRTYRGLGQYTLAYDCDTRASLIERSAESKAHEQVPVIFDR